MHEILASNTREGTSKQAEVAWEGSCFLHYTQQRSLHPVLAAVGGCSRKTQLTKLGVELLTSSTKARVVSIKTVTTALPPPDFYCVVET